MEQPEPPGAATAAAADEPPAEADTSGATPHTSAAASSAKVELHEAGQGAPQVGTQNFAPAAASDAPPPADGAEHAGASYTAPAVYAGEEATPAAEGGLLVPVGDAPTADVSAEDAEQTELSSATSSSAEPVAVDGTASVANENARLATEQEAADEATGDGAEAQARGLPVDAAPEAGAGQSAPAAADIQRVWMGEQLPRRLDLDAVVDRAKTPPRQRNKGASTTPRPQRSSHKAASAAAPESTPHTPREIQPRPPSIGAKSASALDMGRRSAHYTVSVPPTAVATTTTSNTAAAAASAASASAPATTFLRAAPPTDSAKKGGGRRGRRVQASRINVYIYIYVYLQIYMYIYIYIYIYTCIHICIYIYIYIYIYFYLYLSIHLSIYLSIYLSVYIYLSTYLSIYLSIYIYIYIHIHICIHKYTHMYMYI